MIGKRIVYRLSSGFCSLKYTGVIIRSYGGQAQIMWDDCRMRNTWVPINRLVLV